MLSYHSRPRHLAALLLISVCANQSFSQNPETKGHPLHGEVSALIDKLQEIAEGDVGYMTTLSGSGFLPLGTSRPGSFLLGQKPATSPTTMRELVKRGAAAVPDLIAHLDDQRPTKISIDYDSVMGGMFVADEYNYNRRTANQPPKGVNRGFGQELRITKHTVTVGDLCFVALGQIVNRWFNAVRYQPTACIMISSPTRSDVLRVAIKKEWGGLTPARHKESLVRDFLEPDSASRRDEASLRLGYYYPEALEPLALKQLAAPRYDISEVWEVIRDKLYPAKDAKERKAQFDAFLARGGDVARQAILVGLFSDLDLQEADEGGHLSPPLEKKFAARTCLAELFGYPNSVTSKACPLLVPTDDATQARFIDTLVFFPTAKIDDAVRDVLRSTEEEYLALACIRYLIGRGADQAIKQYVERRLPAADENRRRELENIKGRLGWTPLHVAAEVGEPDQIEDLILKGADVNARAANGQTPLHVAAEHGRFGAIPVLLDRKADPNSRDLEDRTPARVGIHFDTVVEMLLARGAVPSDILVASFAGRVDVVEGSLAKDKTSVTATTRDGNTPLHLAAEHGHVKVVEILLAHGADLNAIAGTSKFTALHYAALYGRADVVAVLLAHNADRTAKNWEGKTPLGLAREHQGPNGETTRLLKEEK
jgi:ankyrin repeat protein